MFLNPQFKEIQILICSFSHKKQKPQLKKSIFREGNRITLTKVVGQVFSLNGGGYLKIKLTAPLRFIVLSPPPISYSGPHSASCLNQTIIINLLYILLIQLIFLEHSTFYFTNKLFKRMSFFDRLKYFRVQEEIYNNQKTQKIKVVKIAIGGNF